MSGQRAVRRLPRSRKPRCKYFPVGWKTMIVSRRELFSLAAGAASTLLQAPKLLAQEGQRPVFRIKVDMVVLSFTVTDSKNHYINGLKPSDIKIFEDGIPQKLNTFGEGNKPPVQVMEDGSTRPLLAGDVPAAGVEPDAKGGAEIRSDAFVGTNVFVLFDTSNYMYRGFVY